MLTCAVVALMLGALAAPAVAGAQAAKDEYKLQVPAQGNSTPGGGSAGGSSSGGGAPLALIGLGGIAALCVGVAAWRLRSRGDDSSTELPTGASTAASEPQ